MPAWMGLLRSCHITLIHSSSQTDLSLHPALHTQHILITLLKVFQMYYEKQTKGLFYVFFPSKQDKTLCHCRSPLGVSMDAAFVSLLLPLLLGILLFLFSFRHSFFFFSSYFFSCIYPEQRSCSTACTNTTLSLVYLTLKGRMHNTLNLCQKIILSHLNVSKAKLVAVQPLH